MKSYSLLSLFLLLFCSQVVSAQKKADDLRAIWENPEETDSLRFLSIRRYYYAYSDAQPDSTLALTDYHYKLGKSKNAYKQMIYALIERSNIYRLKGNYDKAMSPLTETLELATTNNDSLEIANTNLSMGNVFISQSDFEKAIQQYTAALKVYSALKREDKEAAILTNLGTLYNVIDYDELALENYNNALLLYEKMQSEEPGLIACYHNIGYLNFHQKKYTKAIAYAEKALQKIEGKSKTYQECLSNSLLAESYHALGQTDRAFLYARKSLALARKLENEVQIFIQKIIIANLTLETDVAAATKQAKALLKEITPLTDHESNRKVYSLLYKCYKAQGKSKLSLEMYELAETYADSIQLEKNKFAATREDIKNDLETRLLDTENKNKKAQATLKQSQSKRLIIIIGGGALLIALIIAYFKSQAIKHRKTRDALLEELELLKKEKKSDIIVDSNTFELNRKKIESSISRTLNETDWKVLNIILEDPIVENKEIAEKAFMSIHGIGSSLRRMYDYFEIKETRHKKIALLTDSIKRSKSA